MYVSFTRRKGYGSAEPVIRVYNTEAVAFYFTRLLSALYMFPTFGTVVYHLRWITTVKSQRDNWSN